MKTFVFVIFMRSWSDTRVDVFVFYFCFNLWWVISNNGGCNEDSIRQLCRDTNLEMKTCILFCLLYKQFMIRVIHSLRVRS